MLLQFSLITPAWAANNGEDIVTGTLFIIGALYFGPSLVAFLRGHLSAAAILVANLLLGWTIAGWVVCLIWSLTGNTKANAISLHKSALREFRDESRNMRESLLLPLIQALPTGRHKLTSTEWLIVFAGAVSIIVIVAVSVVY